MKGSFSKSYIHISSNLGKDIKLKGPFNNHILGKHKQDLVKTLEIHHKSSQNHERTSFF